MFTVDSATDNIGSATGDSVDFLSVHRPASWTDGFSDWQQRAATVSMMSNSVASTRGGHERRARLEEWTCGLGLTKTEQVRPPTDQPVHRRPFTTILEEQHPDCPLGIAARIRIRDDEENASSGYIRVNNSDDVLVAVDSRTKLVLPGRTPTSAGRTPSSFSSGYLRPCDAPIIHPVLTSRQTDSLPNNFYPPRRSAGDTTGRDQIDATLHSNICNVSHGGTSQYDKKSSAGVRLPVRIIPEKRGYDRRKIVACSVIWTLVLATIISVLVVTRE